MKKYLVPKFGWIVAVFVLLACKSNQLSESNTIVLFDFENEIDTTLVYPQDATYEIRTEDGNTFLVVHNGFSMRESGVKLLESTEAPWDLEGRYLVKADVSNLGDEFIQVEMFVGNDPDMLARWYCSDYIDLYPGESGTITVPLSYTLWVHEPQLDIVAMRGIPGKIKTDLKAVDEITFCSRYADDYNTFTIDNVRIEGKVEVRDTSGFFPFVDQFGQYKHGNWKGKIHSVEMLKQASLAEREQLKSLPEPPDRSIYGGWSAGPKLEATGYFRTEKYKDKWWLVDPEGYLFWTAGINCVHYWYGTTPITYREHYFEFLPDSSDEMHSLYVESSWKAQGYYEDKMPYTTFSYYNANLYRTYNTKWREAFRELAHKRLRSWGLNTLGFMSERGTTAQQRTPYVGSIWIKRTPKIEASEGYWGKFHDVFDPRFRSIVKESVERQKAGAGDPWCIGYFIDNELSWGRVRSLALSTLESPAKQPAKIEFIADLKNKYNTISSLNAVWDTEYKNWDELQNSTEAPDEIKAKEDLDVFYQKIAQTYFRTISEELDKVAPNQNYLGCRFAWHNNDIVLRAAADHLDIVSFNKYEYSVADVRLPEGVDRPIMIGEFHFGATDQGALHAGVKVAKSQKHRGELYQSYIQGALRNPQIVGAHWFQYVDQAITGRPDGENYNVGFVDICDTPYEDLIDKVRETNYNLFQYRMAN